MRHCRLEVLTAKQPCDPTLHYPISYLDAVQVNWEDWRPDRVPVARDVALTNGRCITHAVEVGESVYGNAPSESIRRDPAHYVQK